MAADKAKKTSGAAKPITPDECGRRIRSGETDNLYLFYGRDVGALEPFAKKLTEKLCPKEAQTMNLHRFDAQTLDTEALSDAVQVLPMFAERVVVTLTGLNMETLPKNQADILRKIVADIPETTVMIISAGGDTNYKNRRSLTDKNKRFADLCAKHGTVCEFAFRTVSEAARSAQAAFSKNGVAITRHDAEYLAQLCLCETAHMAKEIEKLSAYANGGEVRREDIDALCVRKIESDGFGLALGILGGNAGMVFRRIDELKAQNYEPMQIISIINMSLSDIYRAKLYRSSGKSYQDCAADFKYPKNREFAVKNAFSECSNISVEQIRKTAVLLSDTEYKMKTTSMNTDAAFLALEQFAASAMGERDNRR
jgi:DNA polymerase-3 subunit delta